MTASNGSWNAYSSKTLESLLNNQFPPSISFMRQDDKVIYISKAGNPSHTKAKGYIPVSFCSLLLKELDRVLDVYIRTSIGQSLLTVPQHAYTRDVVLHSFISAVEKYLHIKEYITTS